MSDKKNIADKIVDDSSRINVSNKAVKWIIGILTSGVLGILGFAWGLYINVNNKIDSIEKNLKTEMTSNVKEIIVELEELKKEEVKPNTITNNQQNVDIGVLLERTNSRGESINGTTSRPDNHDTGPVMDN